MGGVGSGRYWRDARASTDDRRSIDVRAWHRKGLLIPGRRFTWQWFQNNKVVASIQGRTEQCRVVVNYRHRSSGEGWKDESYPIRLDWTPCHFGSARPWFFCPVIGCGRRVAILYLDGVFACRRCNRLVYECQRETDDDRAARRADKIREKLGWLPGLLNGRGGRPRGMHMKTYKRLVAEHDFLAAKSLAGVAARMNLSGQSLGDLM